MAIFDRFGIKVVASVGLCGVAMALSPDAAAIPLKKGGYSCVQGLAGETAPAAVAGGPVVAAVCVPPAPVGAALSGAGGLLWRPRCPRVLRFRRARAPRSRPVLRFRRAGVARCRLVLRRVCQSVPP